MWINNLRQRYSQQYPSILTEHKINIITEVSLTIRNEFLYSMAVSQFSHISPVFHYRFAANDGGNMAE